MLKRILFTLLLIFSLSYQIYADSAQAAYVSSGGTVNSPISQWKMNDNVATTVVIDSVGSNTGTSTDNTSTMTVAGKINNALEFNGTDEFITISDAVIPASGNFSISTWVYCAGELAGDTDKYGTVLGSVTWGGTNILGLVLRLSGNNLSVIIGNNISYESLQLVTTIKTTNKEKWYHIVLSYDALTETLTGYTDGVLIGTRDSVGYVDASLGALQIGHSALNSAEAYWYGKIDNTRIFDFGLTVGEVMGLYANGHGTEAENPTKNLQCYSESTIKTQGSYSLKGVAVITDSLNDTLTRTVDPPIDLTDKTSIKYDIYSASRTGSQIKIGIHDSGGTTTEHTANISSTSAWEEQTWDISAVTNANKDVIDSIIITVVNADAANTFYLDNFYGQAAATGGGNMELYTSANWTIGVTPVTIKALIFANQAPTSVKLSRTTSGVSMTSASLADTDIESSSLSAYTYTADVSGESSDTGIRCLIVTDTDIIHISGISLLGLE